MRPNAVKRLLKSGQPAVGTWLSLGSITASRFMARAGFNWLTVDMEHSLVDWETATHMFASIADAGCTALARVPGNRHDHIKRVLDNGAMGVVVPMVNSREEAEHAVAAMKYPPFGNRSVGGSVHALNFGGTATEYYAQANDELLVVLQCEHITSVENADKIFSVPGIRCDLRRPERPGTEHAFERQQAAEPAGDQGSDGSHPENVQEIRRRPGLAHRQRRRSQRPHRGRLAVHCHHERTKDDAERRSNGGAEIADCQETGRDGEVLICPAFTSHFMQSD
jgi:hypothetical protein